MRELGINPKHTNNHQTAYSGDFSKYVDHAEADNHYKAHDFINIQKLKKFLIKEGFITEEELPFDGGTNGSHYWLFFPGVNKHRKKIKEMGDLFAYLSSDPMILDEDECGLVTSAFVHNRRKHPVGYRDDSIKPEDFNKNSFLKVRTTVQFKPGIIEDYTNGKFAHKNEDMILNTVLTDINAGIHGQADELTQAKVDLGHYVYAGIIEGITLRKADYESQRWAQKHTLSAFKDIIGNPAASDALIIKRDLENMKSFEGFDCEENMNVLKGIRKDHEIAIGSIDDKYYKPAIEAAAKELGKDNKVVKVLKLM